MPFIIQTLKGKEKVVEAILRKNGFESKISPLKEFVICQEEPHSCIKDMPQVLNIIEATPEEVEYLLNGKPPEEDNIRAGSLVEITDGNYEGFTGLVRNIRGKEAVVDVSVFGKVLPVELRIEQVRLVELEKQWI